MARAKSTKVYEQILKVRISRASSVFDMLRYDNCVPSTEADSGKLEQVTHGSTLPEDRVVEFRRFSHTTEGPSKSRWKSFGCEVLSWEAVRS